jgi:hypothetical protein
MLSDEDIVRKLRIICHSSRSERYARRATSINGIALAAGLNRRQLYRIVNGEPIGDRARVGLSRVLSCDVLTGEGNAVPMVTRRIDPGIPGFGARKR